MTPVASDHHCPVAGCAWFVFASRGYVGPRLDRHQRTAHPEEAKA